MRNGTSGAYGWLLLALVILGWDIAALRLRKVETLSGAYARANRTALGRLVITFLTGVTVLHLQRWPSSLRRYDPISLLAARLAGKGATPWLPM